MKIGIIPENPLFTDKRVPLIPEQARQLEKQFPGLKILIQSCEYRCIPDIAYINAGLEVKEDISECDIFMSLSPPEPQELIPLKTYIFFSKLIYQKPESQKLLKTALQRKIKLIDYEAIINQMGQRLVDFGRFTGIVGAYNSILAYGRRYRLFQLKPAMFCNDIQEARVEYNKVKLPPIKIVVTGLGNIIQGIDEVFQSMGIQPVNATSFLSRNYNKPVYTILRSAHYYRDKTQADWDARKFYESPDSFESDFLKYAKASHIFLRAHYSTSHAPLFNKGDLQNKDFKIRLLCDLACDVSPLLPDTLKIATLENPFYDYDPQQGSITEAFSHEKNLTVIAVENLAAELPLDASRAFGQQLVQEVFPALANSESDPLIERAVIVNNGRIMPNFMFLERFLHGR